MKTPPTEEAETLWEDWRKTFPPLSEESAAAILHFITQLASLLERRYGAPVNGIPNEPTETPPF